MTTMTEPLTQTLAVPGATLTYDIRPAQAGAADAPVLFLIGSPMGAGGFGTLASHFTDRTVVTYDPRGVERSVKDDPATESTPQQHADDLHRIIAAWVAVRSTSSRAAAARSTPLPSSRPTRRTFGRSSRTSRRWPPSCRTGRVPSQRAARSATPINRAASGPGWPGSSAS